MGDRYAAERSDPRVPQCARSKLSFTFDGDWLLETATKSDLKYPAVSGRSVKGKFDYSVARQKLADEGPIPAGDYWIQPSELQKNAWYRLRNPAMGWGDFWITIHPYPSTVTHGRGGFFIHGGGAPGSAGCIDLTSNINRFVKDLTKALASNTECYIPLIVRYPK